MPKLYVTLGLILLLGLAFWYHGNSNYQSGVNAERVRWQDQVLKIEKERDDYRAQAEKAISETKVVWRDRIRTIKAVDTSCDLPEPIVRVLCDSGIFAGCGLH